MDRNAIDTYTPMSSNVLPIDLDTFMFVVLNDGRWVLFFKQGGVVGEYAGPIDDDAVYPCRAALATLADTLVLAGEGETRLAPPA